MRVSSRVLLLCTLPVLMLVGCRRGADSQPPVATPSITISRPKAALGSPVEITYKFVVAKDAPRFGQDYTVMVHFVDSDEELMWTDNHRPPTPTTQWKPGQTVKSTRGPSSSRCIRIWGMRQSRLVSIPARIPGGCRSPATTQDSAPTKWEHLVARPDRERVPDLQGRVAPSRGGGGKLHRRMAMDEGCGVDRVPQPKARLHLLPARRQPGQRVNSPRTSISWSTGNRWIALRSRRSRSTSSGPR